MSPPKPRFLRTCAVHHKTWYATEGLAQAAIQQLPAPDAVAMSAYPCTAADNEQLWHIGTDRERQTARAGAEFVYQSATPGALAPLTFQPDLSQVKLNGHTPAPEVADRPALDNSIESLLVTAEASGNEVALDLAKKIRALLVKLIDEIRYGEQERLLTERAESLRLELEETLRQIERLRLADAGTSEDEPEPKPSRGGNFGIKEDQAAIRAWAIARGRKDIKPVGQISNALRQAYQAAMAEVNN